MMGSPSKLGPSGAKGTKMNCLRRINGRTVLDGMIDYSSCIKAQVALADVAAQAIRSSKTVGANYARYLRSEAKSNMAAAMNLAPNEYDRAWVAWHIANALKSQGYDRVRYPKRAKL